MTRIEAGHHATPAAVEASIAEAAKKASQADPSLAAHERIRLEYYNRFLSRVFSEVDDSGWVLKGGTSMLARVPSTRATVDIDLFQRSRSLEGALDDLSRLAAVDLGDFFRFDLVDLTSTVGGGQQPLVDGCRVTFDVHIGAKKKGSLHVDLVVSSVMTGDVKVEEPAHALDLPKLQSHPAGCTPSWTRWPTRCARPSPSTEVDLRAGRRTWWTLSSWRSPRRSRLLDSDAHSALIHRLGVVVGG